MVRKTNPEDDDWQHVKDAKKRKQIQDRLAQRARRQRLREAKTKTNDKDQPTSHTIISRQCDCDTSTHTPIRDIHHQGPTILTPDLEPISISFDLIDPSLSSLLGTSTSPSDNNLLGALDFSIPGIDTPFSTPKILSPQSQPSTPLTVFSALYLNGQILGLSCTVCASSRSPFPSPNHPPALHPTETQLMHVHPLWYDRFPFPRMRDSLIKLIGAIDEEELVRDLFTMPSFRIENTRRGESAAWDPGAWRMEEVWRAKWGFLMV